MSRARECRRIRALLVLGFASLSGCDRCGDALMNRVNTPAFERYALTLQSHTGASLKLEACAMFGATRNGYCLMRGNAADVTAFTSGLPLEPSSDTEMFHDSCASLPAFGTPRPASASHVLRPSVRLLIPKGPLPANTDNVKLGAVAVDGTGERVCLEFQFPYG